MKSTFPHLGQIKLPVEIKRWQDRRSDQVKPSELADSFTSAWNGTTAITAVDATKADMMQDLPRQVLQDTTSRCISERAGDLVLAGYRVNEARLVADTLPERALQKLQDQIHDKAMAYLESGMARDAYKTLKAPLERTLWLRDPADQIEYCCKLMACQFGQYSLVALPIEATASRAAMSYWISERKSEAATLEVLGSSTTARKGAEFFVASSCHADPADVTRLSALTNAQLANRVCKMRRIEALIRRGADPIRDVDLFNCDVAAPSRTKL